MKHLFSAVVGALVLVACYECKDPQCSNLPPVEPDYPPSNGVVEVFPDGSEAAAKSPCGRACETFRSLGCSEGQPTANGVSCYRVCLHAAALRKLPVSCWANAKSKPDLRSCGSVKCQ